MKALVQLIGAVLAAVLPLLMATDDLSLTEWINVGVVGAGAVTVYIAANLTDPVWQYTKLFMSAVSAVGVVLVSALVDYNVSPTEWWQIVAAVAAALGVWGVRNPGPSAHTRPV